MSRLQNLNEKDIQSVADEFALGLPEIDAVIGLPGAEGLARALAKLRGLPLIVVHREEESGWWAFDAEPAERTQQAAIVTEHFTDGLPELEVVVQASKLGYLVQWVACAIERTNEPGRSRLELQGLQILPVVQLADTPRGLVMERRFPQN